MMIPVIEQLADDGNELAGYLISELHKAYDVVVSENMAAREFLADHEKTA
jgi:hypothetical protein